MILVSGKEEACVAAKVLRPGAVYLSGINRAIFTS
jgi:hypothetical protein